MGNFVATEQVLETLRAILEERLSKRSSELEGRGPEAYPRVVSWKIADYDLPEEDSGQYPLGVVDLDDDGRTSERREQDTGETAEFNVIARVYLHVEGTKEKLRIMALRIGDAMLFTLMREARGKLPEDGTVLPGWFRVWPTRMRYGQVAGEALMGVEVQARVLIDSSDTFAV